MKSSRPQKVSIVIPCFNESATIAQVISAVRDANAAGLEKEIIVVDDGSEDKTAEILNDICDDEIVVQHEENQGKGAAVRTGLENATGSICLIQDADLELNPADYPSLLQPLVRGGKKVVYGNRQEPDEGIFLYYLGGKFLVYITRILYKTDISDPMVGYKVFHADVLEDIHLKEDGFAFCSEFTGQVLTSGYQIHEVPVEYNPRSAEDKKLNYIDGFRWLWVLIRERLNS